MNETERVEAVAKALSDSCCMFKNRASDRGMVSPRVEVEWSDMLDESDGFVGHPSDGDVMGRDYYREQARAAIAALDIPAIERDAYKRGWNEASKEASEEIRDIERQARWEAQDAYHQGQSDGRDW